MTTFTDIMQDNSWRGRLIRTILQGCLAVIGANIDLLLGYTIIPPELRPVVGALIMAVLSPIMAYLGERNNSNAVTDY